MHYIYDDEFVSIINTLSTSIKEFFKSTRSCIGTVKKTSDAIIDQILGSKSSISDVFMQINSCLISKYSQSKANNAVALTKEKNIKEKLNQIVEKLESINEIRTNVSKNMKYLEQNCSKFYDEAKLIFKNMKITRNQRLDELNNQNAFNPATFNNIKNLNNQYNTINNHNDNLPVDYNFNNLINKFDNDEQFYNTESYIKNNQNLSPNKKQNYKNSFNLNNENNYVGENINNINDQMKEKNFMMSNSNRNFYPQIQNCQEEEINNLKHQRVNSSVGFDKNKNKASKIFIFL